MKKMKSNLDERQEQELLKIEHNGCWLAFWGLLIAIVVQQIFYGSDFRYIAGEWIVFMFLCVYIASACMKKGIWDRRLKPDLKTNFFISLIAGAVFGVVMFTGVFMRFENKLAGAAAAGVISGVFVFAMCFIVLSLMAGSFKKRQQKLEEEPEEEE